MKRPYLTTEDGITHLGRPMENAVRPADHYSACRITDPESGEVVYDGETGPALDKWWDEHANQMFSVEMLV